MKPTLLAVAVACLLTVGLSLQASRATATLGQADGYALLDRLMADLPADGSPPPASLARQIDAVAQQKDAWASGLFWHTDLAAARADARRDGRPILSLRLLGNLTDDESCANSRFFRTALYPDPSVRRLLRERFVLHWQSERPVPIATIDFGDGRMIRRPITGNSIHYVLDADANVVDALPGLYGPGEFAAQLRASADFADLLAASPEPMRAGEIVEHHVAAAKRAAARHGVSSGRVEALPLRPLAPPPARDAARLTFSKLGGEFVTLRAVADAAPVMDEVPIAQQLRAAADRLRDANRLAPESLAVLRSKLPADVAANPSRIAALIDRFEASLARDTALNEFHLRQLLRDWLASGGGEGGPAAFEALNARVYAELFLTPATDPWLGLRGDDAYLALEMNSR